MECCEKCGEWTDFYHMLPNGVIVCEDHYQEYIETVDCLEDKEDR